MAEDVMEAMLRRAQAAQQVRRSGLVNFQILVNGDNILQHNIATNDTASSL